MKKKMYIFIIIGIIIAAAVTFAVYKVVTNAEEQINDITVFAEDYESYNGEELYGNDVLELSINEDAVIYIKTAEEIIDVLENEDALIYFGFPTCPWCRNMLTAFINAATDKGEAIYYVDIKSIRNTYSVEDGLIVESTVGEDAYYEIVEFLSDYLSDYIITDDDDVEYDTETKRLYAPTVVTVSGGEVLDFKDGTLDSVTNPYEELSEEEYDELYEEFIEIIENLQNPSCGLDHC